MLERRSNATPWQSMGFALLCAVSCAVASLNPAMAADVPPSPDQSANPVTTNNPPIGGSAGSSANVPVAAGAPLPMGVNYHIHAGDVLAITVYNEPSLSQAATVLPDGSINMSLAGRVDVGGLSTTDAANRIASSLGSFVRHPAVNVALTQAAQYNVLVLGNVKIPGKYIVRSDARVTDAIAVAGGLGPTNGALPNARITQRNNATQVVSLQRLFRLGDDEQNIALSDGSEVYVTSPTTIDVEVIGAVDHPGTITINEGDHLSMAIARAGNSSNSSADLNHLKVTRVGPDGKPHVYEVNLYQTLEQGDLSVDIPLKKGDVVYVPQSRRHGSAVGPSAVYLLQHLAGFPYY